MNEALLDDRDADLGEGLADVIFAADREYRPTPAGEVVGLEGDIGPEVQRLLAVLDTDSETDAAVRPRELNAPFAEIAGQRRAGHGLVDQGALEAGRLEKVERLDHGPGPEDIPGHAGRFGAASLGGTADHLPERRRSQLGSVITSSARPRRLTEKSLENVSAKLVRPYW